MKSIRKQNCILAIVMFALMSILTSFPVQAQTINQKQAYNMPAYLQKLRHPPVEIYLLQ